MDLKISAVLLLLFLTGGSSLKCYTCGSLIDTCNLKEEICGVLSNQCLSTITRTKGSKLVSTVKTCTPKCIAGTVNLPTGGTVTTTCCDTDLCNGADGMFKGSFLLLMFPLLFSVLFL